LRGSDLEPGQVLAFWENPNIHPLTEYRARLVSFRALVDAERIPFLFGDSAYGLEEFLRRLDGDFTPARCRRCFYLRLSAAASQARQAGVEAFSTTLLVSPYQQHEILREVGEQVAVETGVPFHYRDWRPAFPQTFEAARDHELYRQKYCGCLFSEADRFSADRRFMAVLNQAMATATAPL
jgi:hypothetical protein